MSEQLMTTDFSTMTTGEILAFFDRQDFRDPLGHPLALCQDFIDLISTLPNDKDLP